MDGLLPKLVPTMERLVVALGDRPNQTAVSSAEEFGAGPALFVGFEFGAERFCTPNLSYSLVYGMTLLDGNGDTRSLRCVKSVDSLRIEPAFRRQRGGIGLTKTFE